MTALTAFYDKVLTQLKGCEPAYAKSYIRDAAIEFFMRSRAWRTTSAPITLKWAEVTGITQASPAVVTANAHPFVAGERALIVQVGGMTEANNLFYALANPTANTVELSGLNATSFAAFTTRGDISAPLVSPTFTETEAQLSDVMGGATNLSRSIVATTVQELDSRFGHSWQTQLGTPRWVVMEGEQVRFVPAPDQVYRNYAVLELALKPSQTAENIPDALYQRYREDIEIGALAKLKGQAGFPWSNPDVASALSADFEHRIVKARNRVIRGGTRARITADPVCFETDL